MKKYLLILILLLVVVGSVYAQDYYADVIINIDNEGLTTIHGETNHPSLNIDNSPELTSKEGKHWLFNITVNDVFSNFIYELKLPKNAVINYMKLPDLARLESSSSGITIIGTGENQKISIIVQYQIKKYNSNSYWWTYLLFVILVIAGIHFFLTRKKKKVKSKLPVMTPRQKQIYIILSKNKKSMTQKQIQDIIKLPKSSISRNIETMVKKDILKKEKMGMSNSISIKIE